MGGPQYEEYKNISQTKYQIESIPTDFEVGG